MALCTLQSRFSLASCQGTAVLIAAPGAGEAGLARVWAWPAIVRRTQTATLSLMLYLLGSTANEYFSPALAEVSKKLRLSPTLAGVTLLAFGNGAPDVFSSIAAAKQDQIALSIGGVIGESLFITCVVLAACVCVAGPICVELRLFLRDAGAFLAAVSLLGLYWLKGEISLLQSVVFPLMYVVYVLVVLYSDREQKEASLAQPLELRELTRSTSVAWGEIQENYFAPEQTEFAFERVTPQPAHALTTNLKWSLVRMNWWLSKNKRDFTSLSKLEKVVFVLTSPLRIMRKVTIPLYLDDGEWSRNRATITPPFSILLVLLVLGYSSFALLWSFLGVPLGVFIFCSSKRSHVPSYNFTLVLCSFVLSIFWICSVCDSMVELLALIGTLLSIPVEVLGMTLLALGNSSGDLWADMAVSRLGMPESAVAACFAGPLFNLCIGIGVALIIRTVDEVVAFDLEPSIALCYFVLALVNVYTVVYVLCKRRLTPLHAKVLLLVFCCFSFSLFL